MYATCTAAREYQYGLDAEWNLYWESKQRELEVKNMEAIHDSKKIILGIEMLTEGMIDAKAGSSSRSGKRRKAMSDEELVANSREEDDVTAREDEDVTAREDEDVTAREDEDVTAREELAFWERPTVPSREGQKGASAGANPVRTPSRKAQNATEVSYGEGVDISKHVVSLAAGEGLLTMESHVDIYLARRGVLIIKPEQNETRAIEVFGGTLLEELRQQILGNLPISKSECEVGESLKAFLRSIRKVKFGSLKDQSESTAHLSVTLPLIEISSKGGAAQLFGKSNMRAIK
ncbi:hypothetical protein BC832DRAFT_361984 [Gaertneriomyces semiglobifer]|nr:hypothetical protein BC832DRAFT_361984 [Gaertneriomyces semiglobifer]